MRLRALALPPTLRVAAILAAIPAALHAAILDRGQVLLMPRYKETTIVDPAGATRGALPRSEPRRAGQPDDRWSMAAGGRELLRLDYGGTISVFGWPSLELRGAIRPRQIGRRLLVSRWALFRDGSRDRRHALVYVAPLPVGAGNDAAARLEVRPRGAAPHRLESCGPFAWLGDGGAVR